MTELTIDQALQQGIEAHKAGQVQEADRLYTAILKAQPKHPDANHNMGVLAVGVGKVEQALPFFKTALEANPATAQFWLSYIDALIKLGKLADAKAVFDQAKSKGAKGDGFDKLEQRFKDASEEPLAASKTPAEAPPQQPNILDSIKLDQAIKLAKKKAKDGSPEEAKHIYQDILTKFPKNKRASDGLKGLTGKTVGKASKIQEPPQDQLQSLVNLYSQGQLQLALKQAETLVQQFPKSATLFNIQGAVFKGLGQLELSVDAYNKAIAIKPDYSEVYNNMGVTLKDQGKLEEAIENYNKALAIKPDYAEAYNNIGNALKDPDKLEEAIEAYNKALAIKPDYADAYNNMGNALKEQGKLEEAIAAYNKALAIKPDYAEAYNNMGNALKEQGKLEKSIKAYNKAIAIKPDYAEVYNNMGVALKDQGKLEEAIEAYNKALTIKPDNAEAIENLMKSPFGLLSEESVNFTKNFLEKFSTKIKIPSKLDFLEANYLMHNNRLDLAFDKFCEANNKKLISRTSVDVMDKDYSALKRRLKNWQLALAPKDGEKLIKIFILAPPRSGKSQLETLLSKNQLINPLSDAIKLQNDFQRLTFEKLFFLDEIYLRQRGFAAITSTNLHSIFKAMDIASQIPNSFFIFINRDKYDVASEIFRTDWITGHEFAYDPDNIFRLIELYKNASDAFLEKLPKNSISISFEEILYQPNDALHQVEELTSIQFGLKHLDFTKSKIPLRSVFRKHFHAKFSHLESLNGSSD